MGCHGPPPVGGGPWHPIRLGFCYSASMRTGQTFNSAVCVAGS